MKTRAAVAFEAKKPLEIVELDLEGPKAGEVLVEIKATGICHTDAYTLDGFDSEGIFPSILGHEGAGIVREVGAGRDLGEAGRPRDPALHARMPAVQKLPQPEDQSLHRDPRHPGQGRDARRHLALLPQGQDRSIHYMGCSTFSNFTVLPEIAVAKIREDAPFDKSCYIGCGVTTGVGAVVNTAKVEPGANVVVFGLGGIGLNVIQGARMVGADKIIGVDINDSQGGMGPQVRHDPLRQPEESRRRPRRSISSTLTDGGADYTFDCTGNTTVMRQALEACHRGWGVSVIIGVAEAGKEIATRPFQLVTGRVWKGTAFGGARGRTDVPKIVDWYMDGKIQIDPMITHVLKLEDINEGFDLMHEGKSIRSVVVF